MGKDKAAKENIQRTNSTQKGTQHCKSLVKCNQNHMGYHFPVRINYQKIRDNSAVKVVEKKVNPVHC